MQAAGNVLIAGLGIGMLLTLLPSKPSVTRITVLEKSKTLIDLVGPYYDNPMIDIVHADVFEWETTEKFDTIYFDIWSDISSDNYEATKALHKKYRRNLNRTNPCRYMGSWLRDEVRRMHRRDRIRQS